MLKHLTGHAWTIFPTLRHLVRAYPFPESQTWSTVVEDPIVGESVVYGEYRELPDTDTLVVIIHGLGGVPSSGYLAPIAMAAEQAGFSSLRLALRGTGGGNDFYHAGFTGDLDVAVSHPDFARYERIFVVGFSLGGHIALRAATDTDLDPRVQKLVAVCPPIDLGAGVDFLDSPAAFPYRRWILQELVSIYEAVAAQRPVPTPVDRVRRITTLREWDALVVVPRFGFADVDDYYESQAIAGNIDRIARPALMAHSRHDPMIPARIIDPVLARASSSFEARWAEGAGHVFFPPNVDLGFDAPTGLGPQVLHWLTS